MVALDGGLSFQALGLLSRVDNALTRVTADGRRPQHVLFGWFETRQRELRWAHLEWMHASLVCRSDVLKSLLTGLVGEDLEMPDIHTRLEELAVETDNELIGVVREITAFSLPDPAVERGRD